jgi:chromosome segregation protein
VNNLRLKSLELNGYKTFASQTRFEFAESVTAIVGPNGSGKSNIADALRWVLGEQAYSILRGRKTEDMIFAGSEKRARAGMASATVTFDNDDGWLPIDFSEVSITRRAYRDGQNEYLINQQKVRLKDVNELLSKSALAERTYTVIGQGLVDTALTLKSDERRRLFEEAAGIGLYRSRKDQAQRRLEATRRNLDRVADILAELKPRLRSLERQSRRAMEFTALRTELRESLRAWYGYQWHRAQNDLRSLRNEANTREEKLGLSRQKQSDLQNELNQLRTQTQELRIKLNEWHRSLAELHAGRESSGREIAVANERQNALARQKLALDEEHQRLESERGSLLVRLKKTERDKVGVEAELSDSQTKFAEASRTLNERLDSQKGLNAQSDSLRKKISELKTMSAILQAERKEINSRKSKEEKELIELEILITDISEQIENAQDDQRAYLEDLSQSEKKLMSVESSLAELVSKEIELQNERKLLDGQQVELIREKVRTEAKLVALDETEFAASGFAGGAKTLLDAARKNRLKLADRTLGSSIQLPKELEGAIAAALGDYLEAVLVEERDPEAALKLIEGEDASATLLPIIALSPRKNLTAPKGKGVIGVASELIQATKDIQDAVQLLLGQVVVVEDRQTARNILADLPGEARVVTLRGEVFHREGQIEVRSPKHASSLARPRQQQELRDSTAEIEKHLEKINAQINQNGSTISTVEKALLELRGSSKSNTLEIDNFRNMAHSADLDIEQLQNQQQWFKSQERNLRRQIEEASERQIVIDAEEKQHTVQVAELQKQIELQPNNEIELPLDEFRAQVAHWEMRVAVGQRSQQEAERRLQEQRLLIEKAEQQLASETSRRKELEDQKTAIQTLVGQSDSQESQVDKEIEETQKNIAPAEEELRKADMQLQSVMGAEGKAINALSAAERAHTQAQISLARQQESLSTLRNRIEDDFGLVAFEYDEAVSGPTPLPLGELVERLPVLDSLDPDLEQKLKEQRAQIRRIGSINPEAHEEFISVKERYEDMQNQVEDLEAAQTDLNEVITELDLLMEREFRATFEVVAAEFKTIFSRLFAGGSARLLLIEGDDMSQTGIDIEARLPGKRAQRLALLSGGERSLTATALVFSLLKASPTPFCVMDEVDAMLDEANVGRFTELLGELSKDTQFVLITHNRNTVQAAQVIYGVTMGRDTSSQVISLKLDEVDERFSSGQ